MPALDVLAVLDEEERHLIVTLVNRSANGDPIAVTVSADELDVGPEAELVSLSGDAMYDQNTLDESTRIVPHAQHVPVVGYQVQLSLASFALSRLTFGATCHPISEDNDVHRLHPSGQ